MIVRTNYSQSVRTCTEELVQLVSAVTSQISPWRRTKNTAFTPLALGTETLDFSRSSFKRPFGSRALVRSTRGKQYLTLMRRTIIGPANPGCSRPKPNRSKHI